MAENLHYEIHGHDMQVVEVALAPGETVVAEAGAMNYLEAGITFMTMMGDGSASSQGFKNKIFSAGRRMFTGESIFMTHFTNEHSGTKRVAFAAPYPGKIIPIELATVGNKLICQKGAFLCAAKGVSIGIELVKRFGVGMFGGEGYILQKLEGDGPVFFHVGGCVIKKELQHERIFVDTGCLAAFTQGIDYNIRKAGNLKSMLFGGEGLFLAELSGTGTVYLQSMPFSRLADRIIASAPSEGGSAKGEGSILGGIGRFFGGS